MPMKYARLTEPLVRDNGTLRPATWDEALDRAADGFRRQVERPRARTRSGCSAARRRRTRSTSSPRSSPASAIGTNNIDSCNRT